MAKAVEIEALRPQLATAAQQVYDQWDQSGEDGDPELGYGGICQDVADAMSNVLAEAGIDASAVSASVGDQHVFVVAKATNGVFMVDIPPSVYETGSGYTWAKIPDVVFTGDDIAIDQLSTDPGTFDTYTEDC